MKVELQKGIDILVKAIHEDKKANYDEACRLYELGLERLLYSINNEFKFDTAKKEIQAKVDLYTKRIEEIKKYPRDMQNKPVNDIEDCPASLMQNLAELGQQQKTSVIFMDKRYSSCNTCSDKESEYSTRLKMEFFVQMQGNGSDKDGILILGATDVPWVLDEAVRKRFEKQVYVSLPNEIARTAVFKLSFDDTSHGLTEEDFKTLGKRTEGFSEADVIALVQGALKQSAKKLQTATHFKMVSGPSRSDRKLIDDSLLTPCSPGDPGATEMSWVTVPAGKLLAPTITMSDMELSLKSAKPTVNESDLIKLQKCMENCNLGGDK